MKLRLILLIGVVIVLVAACSPPPQLLNDAFLKDTSLIDNDPCEAPCWSGITPGETSWSEAVIVVEDNPDFANVQIQNADDGSEAVAAGWTTADGTECCQMVSLDGEVVSNVSLLLAPDIRLEQLLDNHGDPTYLVGQEISEDQAAVSLLFAEKNIGVSVAVEGAASGQISPGSKVFSVAYIDPEQMDLIISNSDLYEWNGYGSYAENIDGNFDLVAPETEETEE